jgi:hypothetical protein
MRCCVVGWVLGNEAVVTRATQAASGCLCRERRTDSGGRGILAMALGPRPRAQRRRRQEGLMIVTAKADSSWAMDVAAGTVEMDVGDEALERPGERDTSNAPMRAAGVGPRALAGTTRRRRDAVDTGMREQLDVSL